MKIAVYSGSFYPLHIGHQSIMEYLTCSRDFDWVYLIVSPQSPFKDPSNVLTGRERYDAAVEAVCRHPEIRVWVDDIELLMPPPHYTIRTLEALKEREPENDFTLVVGADNLDCFRGWFQYERILLEFGIAVCPREGYDMEALRDDLLAENPAYRIELLDAPVVTISSTQIREAMKKGADVSAFLM